MLATLWKRCPEIRKKPYAKRPTRLVLALESLEERVLLASPVISLTDVGGTFNGSAFPAIATIAGTNTGVDDTPGPNLEGVNLIVTYYSGTGTSGTALSGAPANAGMYTVDASFAGSTNYDPGDSQVTFVIAQATPSSSLSDSDGTFNGSAFPATATIAGVVTGVDDTPGPSLEGTTLVATYYSGTGTSGTVLSGAPTQPGTYTVDASFAGSTDYAAADSQVAFTISPATPVISVTDPNGTFNGSAYPATATVAGVVIGVDDTPGSSLEGTNLTVTYYSGTDTSGTALSGAPTQAGTYTVDARFLGSTDYSAADNQIALVIYAATPIVSVIGAGGAFNGSTYRATATVAGVVTGVDDTPGSSLEGTGLTFTYSSGTDPVLAGTYSVDASFAGSTDYVAQDSDISFTISQATPVISITDAGGTFNGSAYPASATVAGVVTGVDDSPGPTLEGADLTLTYYSGIGTSGTILSGAPTQSGTYTVDASFAGSADYASYDNTLVFVISPITTTTTVTSSANPSVYGQDVTYTATVTAATSGAGTPSGSVTFAVGSQVQTVALDSDAQARFTRFNVPPGTYSVSATYSGATNLRSSIGSVAQAVIKAGTTTSVVSSLDPSVYGQAVTFTARVQAVSPRAGVPAGTVTFTAGSQTQTVRLDGDAQATFSPATLAVGTYTVVAVYNGNSDLNGSSGSVHQIVDSTDSGGSGTLALFDPITDQILPKNGTPINTYSAWDMSLEAQVAGTAVASYSWDLTNAPDVTSVSGADSYNLQFTWAVFTGSINTDVIALTETSADGSHITATYNFQVTGADNAGWTPAPPTSVTTWPNVIAPDLLNGQATQDTGPYATVGLVDGSVQTSHAMPTYNPNAAPFEVLYNSAAADPQPVFLVRYQLDPSADLPASVTAQLTLTNQDGDTVVTGPVVYYDPSSLNPGDWMQMALPVDPTGVAAGRYGWQVTVTAGVESASYSGAFDFVSGSTGANSLTSAPFGPGWSPANLYRLLPVTGGAILQNPDGTSLWFAQNEDGTYTTPAGDFSTLSYHPGTRGGALTLSTSPTYTRTLKDGSQYRFNAAGEQMAIVDRNGFTTTYAWNSAHELASITDVDGQVISLTYNTGGYLVSVVDPASRTLGFGYNSSHQLTGLTDPDSTVWSYTYTTANELTSVGDPTDFGYSAAGMVSTITLPTGGSESVTPVQAQGLSGAGGGTSTDPTPAVPLANTAAGFTSANGNTGQTYADGLGFGLPQQTISPTGGTAVTNRDRNGLPWLTANGMGSPTHSSFNSQGNTYCLVCASINGDDG